MKFLVVAASLFLTASAQNNTNLTYPSTFPTFPHTCRHLLPIGKHLAKYGVLPGNGWDNLENKERGRVINFQYSSCKTTDDGEFLIPDSVYVEPIKSSSLNIFSEVFNTFSSYTSVTAASINLESNDFLLGGGRFSADHLEVKKHQADENSVTVRVKARYSKYHASLQPGAELDDDFKRRILLIAAHIYLGRNSSAKYETQLLIRDYGTHILTSVDSGAAIVKLDHIDRQALKENQLSLTTISLAASIGFPLLLGDKLSAHYMNAASSSDLYFKSTTSSTVKSYGGPSYKPTTFALDSWIDGIDDNIVPVDRSGDFLHQIITPSFFENVPEHVLERVSSLVESQIEHYYKINTYMGCTNIESPNFSFHANVDDNQCKGPATNLTFGGVFQTCSFNGDTEDLCQSKQLITENPKTGSTSCPSGYHPVPLATGSYNAIEPHTFCHKFLWIQTCHDDTKYGTANYQSYWCVADGQVPPHTGYYFGGVYTNNYPNMITRAKKCPSFYVPLKVSMDLFICVSDDVLGQPFSLPFAGFFSCSNGNELAITKGQQGVPPRNCPPTFSPHLATIAKSTFA